LIGQGWVVVFAQAGFGAAMFDLSSDAAERALNNIMKHGTMPRDTLWMEQSPHLYTVLHAQKIILDYDC
jgi:3-hydroxyacyl-CoA dehydrogenase